VIPSFWWNAIRIVLQAFWAVSSVVACLQDLSQQGIGFAAAVLMEEGVRQASSGPCIRTAIIRIKREKLCRLIANPTSICENGSIHFEQNPNLALKRTGTL
jgi:hypothetical protein